MRYGHFIMSIFCAWVMWSVDGKQSLPLDAFATKEECVVARGTANKRSQAVRASPTPPVTQAESPQEGYDLEKERLKTRLLEAKLQRELLGQLRSKVIYRCLPDTVDPRAPKAGK